MTGMKKGAGENPFEDTDDPKTDTEEDEKEEVKQKDPMDKSQDEPDQAGNQSGQAVNIPYKYRRDSVQDGRSRVPLFLQDETKQDERELQRNLEDTLDEDISLTDLREAAIKAGIERPDAVRTKLEQWGYGMTFE